MSSDESPPRKSRVRHDSSDDDSAPPRRSTAVKNESPSPPRKSRVRHNSSDDDSAPPRRSTAVKNESPSPPRKSRVRHNSSDDDSAPPRRRKSETLSSSSSSSSSSNKKKLGLQSGKEFGEKARELKNKRDLELKYGDASLSGAQAETTYRDKKGRKLDMLNEFMRQSAIREGKEVKLAKAQHEWGKGAVQKDLEKAAQEELEHIANEPFARSADDLRLENYRKEEIRDEDPMAEYFKKKRETEQIKNVNIKDNIIRNTKPRKPIYKGPNPPSNRFNILPGYRWDGVERGISFEKKLSITMNKGKSLKEDEYKWSTSEM
jgi:pre-mRNA-splicing factor CWC26